MPVVRALFHEEIRTARLRVINILFYKLSTKSKEMCVYLDNFFVVIMLLGNKYTVGKPG